MDAAHRVERRHVSAAEPEADVGLRKTSARMRKLARSVAEGRVDPLELVAHRDERGVVVRTSALAAAEHGGLERLVQRLALAAGPGLDDVTDEGYR